MRRDRNRRVAVLSDASFAPLDPLRHPPQGVSVHSHNDRGDTGGRGQDPVMDGLVAELGCGGSALHAGPQQLRLQLNDPLFERLAFTADCRTRCLPEFDAFEEANRSLSVGTRVRVWIDES